MHAHMHSACYIMLHCQVSHSKPGLHRCNDLTLLCLLHIETVELVETLHYVRHAADLLHSNFLALEAAAKR